MTSLLAISLLCPPTVGLAQGPAIRVGPGTRLATGTEYEPHLAIDPSNPRHWVAAAIVGAPGGGTFEARMGRQRCAAFASFDDGATWSRHDFATTWCYDPWVVVTPDGQAVVSMVAAHASLPQQGRAGLLVFRSADGGRTWDDRPVGLGRSHDHATMALDLGASGRRGWLYVLSHRPTRADDGRLRYGLYTARSRDGGRTFDDPVYVVVNNLHNLAEMPVVLRDGTLVGSFVDAGYWPDSAGSDDLTFFERRRAWVVRSTDGGHTFSSPLFVTDACGPPPDYRLSAFAADVSAGAFAGRLYFACRRKGGGPIVVTASGDGGETWSAATAVHAVEPDPAAAHRIPGLAVNDRGVVAVAWIDGTGKGAPRCEQHVYVAASTNGGRTFSRGREVSRSADCGTGGDYFGLVAAPDGRFRLLWSGGPEGRSELWTATVEVDAVAEPTPPTRSQPGASRQASASSRCSTNCPGSPEGPRPTVPRGGT